MKNADSVTFTAIIHKKQKIFDFYQILLKNVKIQKPVIVTTITGQNFE